MLTVMALLLAALLGQGPIHINVPVGGPPGGPVAADQTGGGPGHSTSTTTELTGGTPPVPPVDDQTGGGPG